MGTFLELAHDRYSVRKISSRPVEEEKIEKIIEAGIVAPTATNAQPIRIFVLKSQEAKELLMKATSFPFVKSAPVNIVVGSCEGEAWVRPFDGKNYADVDASIVATHIMMEIHDLGLGSTWCGFFDPEKMKEEFPEMKGCELIALFPVGYPEEDSVPARKHTEYRDREELVREF
jgi:nitroreductase